MCAGPLSRSGCSNRRSSWHCYRLPISARSQPGHKNRQSRDHRSGTNVRRAARAQQVREQARFCSLGVATAVTPGTGRPTAPHSLDQVASPPPHGAINQQQGRAPKQVFEICLRVQACAAAAPTHRHSKGKSYWGLCSQRHPPRAYPLL